MCESARERAARRGRHNDALVGLDAEDHLGGVARFHQVDDELRPRAVLSARRRRAAARVVGVGRSERVRAHRERVESTNESIGRRMASSACRDTPCTGSRWNATPGRPRHTTRGSATKRAKTKNAPGRAASYQAHSCSRRRCRPSRRTSRPRGPSMCACMRRSAARRFMEERRPFAAVGGRRRRLSTSSRRGGDNNEAPRAACLRDAPAARRCDGRGPNHRGRGRRLGTAGPTSSVVPVAMNACVAWSSAAVNSSTITSAGSGSRQLSARYTCTVARQPRRGADSRLGRVSRGGCARARARAREQAHARRATIRSR